MRRLLFNLSLVIILLNANSIVFTFPTKANYYTINASISSHTTYQVTKADFSGFSNISYVPFDTIDDEFMNILGIFDFAFEINISTQIKYRLSKVNDSHITYYKDYVYVFPNVTKSYASSPEYQNLSNFLITNRILTDNITLINEYVTASQDRISYFNSSVSDQYFTFYSKFFIGSLNYTINSTFENGWMTHLHFILINDTCGLSLLEFEMIKLLEYSPPSVEYIFPVNTTDYYTFGLNEGNYLILEVIKSTTMYEQGVKLNIEINELLHSGVNFSASVIYPNGTEGLSFSLILNFTELYISNYFTCTNISLIQDLIYEYEYWNFSYNSQNMTFAASIDDYSEFGIRREMQFTYDRTTGWLLYYSVNDLNMSTNNYTSEFIMTTVDYTPRPPNSTTTTPSTTSSTTITTSTIHSDTSETIPTSSEKITSYSSIGFIALFFIMLAIAKRKEGYEK
ncbi:MAG: hypothetical protein ACTSW1_12055 [Candidatus Hodarchaeales archaeon]